MTTREWTAEELGKILRGYQAPAVLCAAAELDLFGTLRGAPFTATEAARRLEADPRGTRILLDALAALELLEKEAEHYRVPESLGRLLSPGAPGSYLAMVQHQAACLRNWSQLAASVKTGRPSRGGPGIRGAEAEFASFIEAMDNVSGPAAPQLVAALGHLSFRHLLDVGGGSGTWTAAFLHAFPESRATLFDLPPVMGAAGERLHRAGVFDRVALVPGDYHADPLPAGADLVWLSAIVHQNSREQNRALFAKSFHALEPGGQVLVRDFLMEPSRTAPVAGALFAVNMLSGTQGGDTFTVQELTDDLTAAGFKDVEVLRQDGTMLSLLRARRP